MTDLATLITKTLGVAPSPPAPIMPFNKPPQHKAPSRPFELYEYKVNIRRSEYGTATVHAESTGDAYNESYGDIDWHGSDDEEEITDVTLVNHKVVNQDELDDWDERYGDHFDNDGDPMCTECREYNPPSKPPLERSDKDDGYGWFCQVCLIQ